MYVFEFLEIREIFGKVILLSRDFKNRIEEENYLLFMKLIRTFKIPFTYELNDLPARENVIQVFKKAQQKVIDNKLEDLTPFAFYTNGGTYNSIKDYFI